MCCCDLKSYKGLQQVQYGLDHCYSHIFCYNMTSLFSATLMTIALILLPSLLPEPSVATLSSGKGKNRAYWKPSVSESMSYFIDVQKVLLLCAHFSCPSS